MLHMVKAGGIVYNRNRNRKPCYSVCLSESLLLVFRWQVVVTGSTASGTFVVSTLFDNKFPALIGCVFGKVVM
jgi:hypothetical protein